MELIQKLFGHKPASPPATMPSKEHAEREGLKIAVGALTDKGRTCDHNEDTLFVLSAAISQQEDLLPMGFYVIADGMGGHAGGKEASDIAVRLVTNWVLERIYRPFLVDVTQTEERQPINQVLVEALVVAGAKIHEACPDGGTTLTCAFVLGTNAFLAHVGDSRAYLVSRNTLRQITTDHSLVNRLIELGQLTSEEAKTHPQRNVLYRALGRAGNLEVDTHLQSLPANSSLLLCSDGLWSMVPDREIRSIVDSAPSPQVACNQLIARANENGGEDNITAVLIRV